MKHDLHVALDQNNINIILSVRKRLESSINLISVIKIQKLKFIFIKKDNNHYNHCIPGKEYMKLLKGNFIT